MQIGCIFCVGNIWLRHHRATETNSFYLIDLEIVRNIMLDRINCMEVFLKFIYMVRVGEDNYIIYNINHDLCIAFEKLGVLKCVKSLSVFEIKREISGHSQIGPVRPDDENEMSECEKT